MHGRPSYHWLWRALTRVYDVPFWYLPTFEFSSWPSRRSMTAVRVQYEFTTSPLYSARATSPAPRNMFDPVVRELEKCLFCTFCKPYRDCLVSRMYSEEVEEENFNGVVGQVVFFLFYFFYLLFNQTPVTKSKLWSFLAVRVLALSRPEVSASSYKQRTKRERGERRKKNMYSQFRKTARCLDERSSKLGLFKSHDQ